MGFEETNAKASFPLGGGQTKAKNRKEDRKTTFEEQLKKRIEKTEQEIEKVKSGEWKNEFMIDAKKTNLDLPSQLRLSYVAGRKHAYEDAVAVAKEHCVPKEQLVKLLKKRPIHEDSWKSFIATGKWVEELEGLTHKK